jgi:hypothetical protein
VDESVSTFGLWDIKPNFYNAVPRSVRVDIDIRDSDKERRDGIISATLDGAEQIAARRKCGYSGEIKFEYPIAKSDKKVQGLSLPNCQRLSMCSLCQLCQSSELPASGSQGKIAFLWNLHICPHCGICTSALTTASINAVCWAACQLDTQQLLHCRSLTPFSSQRRRWAHPPSAW